MITKTDLLNALEQMGYTEQDFFTEWDGYILESIFNRLRVDYPNEKVDWYIDRCCNSNIETTPSEFLEELVELANLSIDVGRCADCEKQLVIVNDKNYTLLQPGWEDEMVVATGTLNDKKFAVILCDDCDTNLKTMLDVF